RTSVPGGPPDLRAKGLDQQGLDVADRVLRLSQQSLGHFAKLPSPVRERTGQHWAKAEPREAVPPAGVAIESMGPQPDPDVLIPGQADVVGTVVVVQDVDPPLGTEVANLEGRSALSQASQQSEGPALPLPGDQSTSSTLQNRP